MGENLSEIIEEYKVLDTNVLLHGGAKVLSAFKPKRKDKVTTLIIPLVVFNELDKFKRDMNTLGKNARAVANAIKEARKKEGGSLLDGVKLSDNYYVKSIRKYDDKLDKEFNGVLEQNKPDTVIFKTALSLHRQGKKVEFVTHDTILSNIADACGITVNEWEDFSVLTDYSSLYKGRRILSVRDGLIDSFYEKKRISLEEFIYCEDEKTIRYVEKNSLFSNEYFLLKSLEASKKTALARYDAVKQKLVPLHPLTEKNIGNLTCKNYEQKFAMDALLTPDISLVHLIGPAGTGKTILALAAACYGVMEKIYKKIFITKPLVASGKKDIGFLPGSKEEKLKSWVAPIYDNLPLLITNEKEIKQFSESYIEAEASTYLRGRSLPEIFFILDECQNATPDEVKTTVTRIGEDSKVVLTGDPSQIDDPYLSDTNNGLCHSNERMKKEDFVATIFMEQCVRSKLSEAAAKLL
ncbi:PhoH family protein [Candidatus Woesearchaeota archaeon]|nr:PhoH family protein [Candidatus Woesearchaeota archaeon]